MSLVWVCIPSARPAYEVLRWSQQWQERGYGVALWRDPGCETPRECRTIEFCGPYPGYAEAVNKLARIVLGMDQSCNWIVTGGDDVEPDANHSADEIARECSEHFAGTFGVMQPTGDRWRDGRGAYIDRVAGSPWMGREWCIRAHGGRGPLWPGFKHMFVDEALRAAAMKLGVYWERRDLIHLHNHALRKQSPTVDDWPAHMAKWNTPEHWRESKAEFERLKASDFAECMPL